MSIKLLCPTGVDLASRQSAARLRHEVERELDCSERVTIDLSKVQSISESYADEIFGVLAATYGIEVFSGLVSIHGASSHVLRSVARAIRERLLSGDQAVLRGTLQSLVAAKKSKEHHFCSCS